MTWTDQRPMAFSEADALLTASPQDEGWEWAFDLWWRPRPIEGSTWSNFVWWWWDRCAVGVVVADAQGLRARGGRVSWGGLCQVQLEVWLLSDTYLELCVALKTRGEGVKVGGRAEFKVVLPHTVVSASVPVKQNEGVGYLDLKSFVEIWPLLCFYAQTHGIHVQHLLALENLEGGLPAWDVEEPDEDDVPSADPGWWMRGRVENLIHRDDAGVATSLQIPYSLNDLEQEGFDYLFARLASWPSLTSLKLIKCPSLKNVDGLANLTNLTELDLSLCKSLENVDGLANLTNLTSLDLSCCKSLKNVDGLGKLTNLTTLGLSWCKSLKNVDGLGKLTNLTSLDLSWCKSLKNVDGLANLTNLTRIDLRWCDSLENVDGLAKLTNLTKLDLRNCISLSRHHQRLWTGRKLRIFFKSLRKPQNAT